MRKRQPRAIDSRGAEDVCSFRGLCLRIVRRVALTGAPVLLCVLDLDGVRVAAAAVDDAAGDDDLVALFERHDGAADLQRVARRCSRTPHS